MKHLPHNRPMYTRKPWGFTLIELLVVVAVIGILASILLPALNKAKQKATQAGCTSNLKQVGMAIQMYVDDNEGTLPGPCWSGARANYDDTSSTELIFYIAENLGELPPSRKMNIAEVFICPGFRRNAPALTSFVGRKCYMLNDDLDPDPNVRTPPFGYPNPVLNPLKHAAVGTFEPPANVFAVTDVDKGNVNPIATSWWDDLPYKPVHGRVRMELYFDWHVAPKRW